MDNIIRMVKENALIIAAAIAAYFLFIKKK